MSQTSQTNRASRQDRHFTHRHLKLGFGPNWKENRAVNQKNFLKQSLNKTKLIVIAKIDLPKKFSSKTKWCSQYHNWSNECCLCWTSLPVRSFSGPQAHDVSGCFYPIENWDQRGQDSILHTEQPKKNQILQKKQKVGLKDWPIRNRESSPL